MYCTVLYFMAAQVMSQQLYGPMAHYCHELYYCTVDYCMQNLHVTVQRLTFFNNTPTAHIRTYSTE